MSRSLLLLRPSTHASVCMLLVVAACRHEPESPAPEATNKATGEVPVTPAEAVPDGGVASQTVTLFFPSSAYVASGDEALPHVVAEERRLKIGAGSTASAAVAALRSGPTRAGADPLFRSDLHVNSVSVEGDTALVDFRRQGLSGGSLEERLIVEALVRTLTALPGVARVRFTVDGQTVESLMGHLSVEQPLSIDDAGDVAPQPR